MKAEREFILPLRRPAAAIRGLFFALMLFGMFLTGCSSMSQAAGVPLTGTPAADCVPETEATGAQAAAVCAPAGLSPATPTLPASQALAPSGPNPEAPAATALPSPAAATINPPTPAPTPCPPDRCIYTGRLVLARPVIPPGRDTIDNSYRFGSTQGGQRDPHHGVEFLNSQGTPVLAAAGGEVVVAGDDRQTLYGPYAYFYGNLVVLKHTFPDLPQPLFTLYGHLSKLDVKLGDIVRAGQEIGLVGMTGIATGSHLHFEVRLGENTYQQSRNPELWLAPLAGPDGQLTGALAGRILDTAGNDLPVESVVLEHIPAAGGMPDLTLYLDRYAEQALIGQAPYAESFAAGSLPAGRYRLSFVQSGMQEVLVEVLPGQLTVLTITIR